MNLYLFFAVLSYLSITYVLVAIIVAYKTFIKLPEYKQNRVTLNFTKEFILLVVAITYLATYYLG